MWGQAKNVAFFSETLSIDQPVNPTHAHMQSFLCLISVSVFFSVLLPAGSSERSDSLLASLLCRLADWLRLIMSRWRGQDEDGGDVRSLEPESQVVSPLWKVGRKQTYFASYMKCPLNGLESVSLVLHTVYVCTVRFCICWQEIYMMCACVGHMNYAVCCIIVCQD